MKAMMVMSEMTSSVMQGLKGEANIVEFREQKGQQLTIATNKDGEDRSSSRAVEIVWEAHDMLVLVWARHCEEINGVSHALKISAYQQKIHLDPFILFNLMD